MILRKELWVCFGALAFLSASLSGINLKSFQEAKKAQEVENIKKIEYSLNKKIDNLRMDSQMLAVSIVEGQSNIPVLINHHNNYDSRNQDVLRKMNDELITEYLEKIEKKKKMRAMNKGVENESL